MAQSRTQKSILNSSVSLLFYLMNVGITVFMRPVFLEHLGLEVQGIQSTMGSVFSTISLAELGLGSAIAYALYRPLFDKDQNSINEIISIQAWFYRRVAIFVVVVALGLSLLFPYFFTEVKPIRVPLWYVYGFFSVSLISSMVGYLVNYRSIIFTVDQRGYRLTMNIQGVYIGRNIIQILILLYVPDPYIYYLAVEIFVTLLGVLMLERMLHKDYPWLNPAPSKGRLYLAKYPAIMKKTKQIFAHKLAEVALGNVTSLVFLAYASFEMRGAYDNYIVLYSNLGVLINSMLNSVSGGIGSLVAEDNGSKIKRFFWEYVAIKNFFATLLAFALFLFSSHLIPIWLGDNPNNILPQTLVFWIALNGYISCSRGPMEMFLAAKGMYQDVWAPIVEAVINIGASIALGYFFGLPGVLAGGTLSVIAIPYVWKSVFLFKYGFGESPLIYWVHYIKYPIIATISILVAYLVIGICSPSLSSLRSFLINGIVIGAVYTAVLFVIYYIASEGFRTLLRRFAELFLPKLKQVLRRYSS